MELLEIVKNELNIVRTDLQELKRCQLQYFTLSITGTGAILGIVAPLQGLIFQNAKTNLAALALLAPILVVFPCWLIFFDKATTITRLVGYQQTLEHLLCGNVERLRFVGLESALAEMRKAEKRLDDALSIDRSAQPSAIALLLLQTRNRYWMINWYTYTILSLVACTLGYNYLGEISMTLEFPLHVSVVVQERTLWGGGAFVGFFLIAMYTLTLVWQLTRGYMTYDAYAAKWRTLLAAKTPGSAPTQAATAGA